MEKEIFYVEKSLHQSKIDLENLKSIQEEKEETLRVMTRAVKEEEKKIERAKVIMYVPTNYITFIICLERVGKIQGRTEGRAETIGRF